MQFSDVLTHWILPNPDYCMAQNRDISTYNDFIMTTCVTTYSAWPIVCQHHFQSRENETCHVLCSSCLCFEVSVARTVPNSHVMVICSIPFMFSKSGVLRTVNGAPSWSTKITVITETRDPVLFISVLWFLYMNCIRRSYNM